MQSILIFSLVVIALLLIAPHSIEAYIGPGAGMAAIGTVIALIGSIFLAIVAFLWYPIKRFLAKFKKKRKSDQEFTKL